MSTPNDSSSGDRLPAGGPFRLHHVGIVVRRLEEGRTVYRRLGFDVDTPVFEDPIQRVLVQFILPAADVLVELIEPAGADSPVSRFLEKSGPGLHHLCYEVDDIDRACELLRDEGGIVTCEPVPAVAFSGRRVAFVYWQRSIVEFVEAPA